MSLLPYDASVIKDALLLLLQYAKSESQIAVLQNGYLFLGMFVSDEEAVECFKAAVYVSSGSQVHPWESSFIEAHTSLDRTLSQMTALRDELLALGMGSESISIVSAKPSLTSGKSPQPSNVESKVPLVKDQNMYQQRQGIRTVAAADEVLLKAFWLPTGLFLIIAYVEYINTSTIGMTVASFFAFSLVWAFIAVCLRSHCRTVERNDAIEDKAGRQT